METIQTKYFTDKIGRLVYIGDKSGWIDLRAAEGITLKTGEFKLTPLGVAVKLSKGYEAYTMPKNSTFKNFGIIQTNYQGVTDETYCSDGDQWYFPIFAMRDITIKTSNRICQFHIMEHQPVLQFNEIEALVGQDRDETGNTGIQ